MQLKMAPNSGFAILLRSPWWVSFAVAAAIALACLVLLPSHLAPFAAAGALPIAVIGCIAAWRQWHAPRGAQVDATLAQALALPWRDLAQWLEQAWRAAGHEVQPAGGPDADLLLRQGTTTTLVAARRCKAASHGVQPLRALHQQMQRVGAHAGIYVVLQGNASDGAAAFARDNGIELLQGAALASLLLKAPR